MNDNRRPLRNHPVALVKNITSVVVLLLIIAMSIIGSDGSLEAIVGLSAMGLLMIFLTAMFWMRTTIEFGDRELTVRRNFISRKTRVIPYSKIASINVNHSIFDRIAGTETLSFNVNSSVNAAGSEASFTFKRELAERIRDEIYSKLFKTDSETDHDEEHESVVSFTSSQVIAHSILSQPTLQLVWSIIFLSISIISFINENSGGFSISAILFIVQGVIPIVSTILRYHGFKMYRDGNTICLQYGAIQNYRSEFEVSRINALRVRRPFLARIMHQACLEAEVIGIDATDNVTSMLCLMMSDEKAESLMRRLLPEFDCDIEELSPPRTAWKAMACQSMIITAIIIAVISSSAYLLMIAGAFDGIGGWMESVARLTPVSLIILLSFYSFWRGWRSSILFRIGIGDDMLVMRNGLLDREWVIMHYENIQMVRISNDLIAGHFGVSRCTVSLLSTVGSKDIRSGYFDTMLLERIPEMVQNHIDYGQGPRK